MLQHANGWIYVSLIMSPLRRAVNNSEFLRRALSDTNSEFLRRAPSLTVSFYSSFNRLVSHAFRESRIHVILFCNLIGSALAELREVNGLNPPMLPGSSLPHAEEEMSLGTRLDTPRDGVGGITLKIWSLQPKRAHMLE